MNFSAKNRLNIGALMPKAKKISIVSLVFLWLIYLVSANHAANQSFEIDSLSKELQNTQHQILLMNVESGELQSIERIENASKSLSLVQTKDVYYLVDNREIVALK